MRLIRSAIAGILTLLAVATASAQVPQFPQTLPPQTVIGRLGITPGPTQAIPFSTLLAQMLGAQPTSVTAAPFNAKCNGATDDTAAIAAAIAATPSGGTLTFPAGSCLVSGSGTQIFTITTPINLVGVGSSANGAVGSTLLLAAGVPSTRDIFHITGLINVAARGYSFKNFNIGIASGSGAKNVFHFDSTAGTTTGFAEVMIDNVVMPATVSAGGNSVLLNNGVGTNTNGGTFNFTIQNSFVGGGIQFLKAGDTLRVLNNIITGANAGVTSDQVSGAGQLLVSGNNITSTGGCVIVAQGIAPIIQNNECEQIVTSTEANNAIVDLTGSVANVSNAKIVGNQIQGVTGTATPIRVAAATGTVIDHNRLGTPSAYAHIVNTASASGTVLGAGNTYTGGGANISDLDATHSTIYAPLSKGTPLAVLGNISSVNYGPVADIIPSNINQVLRADGSGSSIGFGQTQLAGGATSGVTGILPPANGGANAVSVTSAPYNAKCDGVTDDTTAIASAITATPSGGTLVLPATATGCLVSGSGTQIFTLTTPINIIGAGSSANGGTGTTLLLATGVPSTRDVFRITGLTNTAYRGYSFKSFNVSIVSGTGGKNVFHFDTTAGTSTGFAEIIIDSIVMPAAVSAGGNSVFLDNGASINVNGGTFNFTIQNCFIAGGLNFLKIGDTIRVLNNIITGASAGITSDQIAGAGQLLVFGNNITSGAGQVVIANGVAPIIENNIFEQLVANTEANNSIIDLTGSVGNISSAKIINNQIHATASMGNPTLIRIAAATGTIIDGNRLGTPAAYAHIINTAASSGLVLGLGNTFAGGGANITDSGTLTIDPTSAWVAFTPSFSFTGGTGVSATSPVGGYKQTGKTLLLRAQATMTYTAAPTAITVTLPASLVAVAAQAQNCLAYNNFNGQMGVGQIAGGNTTITASTALPTATGQPFVLSCGSIEVQ